MRKWKKRLFLAGLTLVLIVGLYYYYHSTKPIEAPEIVLHAEWELKGPKDDPRYTLYRPSAIRYQSGYLYVCDEGKDAIIKYDESGKFVQQIGRAGQGPGEFVNPVGIAVHPDGTLFVLDKDNGRVQVFDAAGRYLRSFSVLINLAGTGIRERILDIDQDKRVYLPSGVGYPGLITVYAPDGTKIGQIGEKLTFSSLYQAWQRNNEIQLAVDESNHLYVQFHSNPILRKYRLDGQLIWERNFSKVAGVRASMASITETVKNASSPWSLSGFTLFIEPLSNGSLVLLVGKEYLVCERSYYPVAELRFFRVEDGEEEMVFARDVARGPAGKFYVLDSEGRILRYMLALNSEEGKWTGHMRQ